MQVQYAASSLPHAGAICSMQMQYATCRCNMQVPPGKNAVPPKKRLPAENRPKKITIPPLDKEGIILFSCHNRSKNLLIP